MKPTFASIARALSLAPILVSALSCRSSPRTFCAGWAEEACQARTSCCRSGEVLNVTSCEETLAAACDQLFPEAYVKLADYTFDVEAARACLSDAVSCAVPVPSAYLFASHPICGNVINGHEPLGAFCPYATVCERTSDPVVCYFGADDTQEGMCSTSIPSTDGTCGYRSSTHELRVCPEGTICDHGALTAGADGYEFTAPCTPPGSFNAPCVVLPGSSLLVPCEEGFYCDVGPPFTTTGTNVCRPRKPADQGCASDDECAAGLLCVLDGESPEMLCTEPTEVPFCVVGRG